MTVRMTLTKAIGCMIVALAIYYSVEKQSLNMFFGRGVDVREKRAAESNSSEYVLIASVNISDLERLRNILSTFSLPFNSSTFEITSIETTTVCSPNTTGYQCRCEENFAWSYNNCISYKACDAITAETCGCISTIPPDNQVCQLNTSSPVTPSPTLLNETKAFILEVRIPVSDTSFVIEQFRSRVNDFRLPHPISNSLQLTGLNFTTACQSNLAGGLQCQCEEQFAWSCDKCSAYNVCSNATTPTCECINMNAPPTDGAFCEPITSIASCPSPPSVTTPSTPPTPTPSTPAPPTPTPSTPAPPTPTPSTLAPPTPTPSTPAPPTPTPSTPAPPTPTPSTPAPPTPTPSTPAPPTSTPPTSTPSTPAPPTSTPSTPAPPTSTPPTSTPSTPAPPTSTPSTPAPPTSTPSTPAPLTLTTPTSTPAPPTPAPPTPAPPTPAPPTPTTPSTPTPITEENLSITLNLDYSPDYNDENNQIHKDIKKTITEQCEKYIPSFTSVKINNFRRGSTIIDYTITATAMQQKELTAVKGGISMRLAEQHGVIIDSTKPLEFQQPFFGESATVTCGPVPSTFSDSWTAEWRRDSKVIIQDSNHIFTSTRNFSTLKVERFFVTDNGNYVCRLTNNSYTFRQTATINFKPTPNIQVTPILQRISCADNPPSEVQLQCSVGEGYQVEFTTPSGDFNSELGQSISLNYPIGPCETEKDIEITCQVVNAARFKKEIILKVITEGFTCDGEPYGEGREGDTGKAPCAENEVGERLATCRGASWTDEEDNCILEEIQNLLDQSNTVNDITLPDFLDELSNTTISLSERVVNSTANINAVVDIFKNVARRATSLRITINKTPMTDVLLTAGVLTTDGAKESWASLNKKSSSSNSARRSNDSEAESVSSSFLQSIENITSLLSNDSFVIYTNQILLTKTTFTDTFNEDFNSSVLVDIPQANGENEVITVITFASMDNVLPARNETSFNNTSNVINGRVVLVQSSAVINNISFTFDTINSSLNNPQCVFWNFSLFNGLGGWDSEGCTLESEGENNKNVTCNCNHLTSFSILMSPFSPDSFDLDIITYAGVSISLASLVICLIIEAVVWRKIRKNNTSYLRHVSIVNIAVSLLIADIWFIIGANISGSNDNKDACITATFFIHLFYLALFFWMLASALLLLYRTVSVFGGGLSTKSILAIGFCLGYGAPLIITIITIAVTQPNDKYLQDNRICWLRWGNTKPLLAFVIPALLIVVINFFILLVVIYKMLRRRAVTDASNAAEKSALVVILRSLAVLTPIFGLTWGLGVGTMTSPSNKGIHIAFAFFNSLQGFFILVFGTLLDKKVRSEITLTKSETSRGTTRSTSGGISSSSGLAFLRNFGRRRDGYNMSSSDSSASQSYINT